MTLEARLIDSRDVGSEVDDPTFRVAFWRTRPGLSCRDFEVTGVDVNEAIDWAERNTEVGETYVLSVLTVHPGTGDDQLLLTRIKGADPSRSDGDGPSTAGTS